METGRRSRHQCFASILCIAVSTLLLFLSSFFLEEEIIQKLPLTPGSQSFEGWRKIPFPIYEKFYFFNVTNAQEFMRTGETPKLVEIGPYVYRSKWIKEEFDWHSNGTVSYRERKIYWFDRNSSSGSEDDLITTINTPLVALAEKLKTSSAFVKLAVLIFLNAANETLFIRRSIKQLTYEGYPDILSSLSHIINPDIPVKNGKFGYMVGTNDTDDGVFNVFTGEKDIRSFNEIDKFRGLSNLTWWDSNTTCSELRGTNGQLVHPLRDEDTFFYFFSSSFCKPWKLKRHSWITSYDIKLIRFVAPPEILYNSTLSPSNKCYEKTPFPSGVMDLSRCKAGVPLFLSMPHFLDADPIFLKNVSGLQPNKEKHQFRIDIEPHLGMTLGLEARIQINIKLERVDFIGDLRNISNVILPIFWQEIIIQQDGKFAKHIFEITEFPLRVLRFAGWFLFLLGLIYPAMCIRSRLKHCFLKRQDPPLLNDADEDQAPLNEGEPNDLDC